MAQVVETRAGTPSGRKSYGKYDHLGRRRMGNSHHSKQMLQAGAALWNACIADGLLVNKPGCKVVCAVNPDRDSVELYLSDAPSRHDLKQRKQALVAEQSTRREVAQTIEEFEPPPKAAKCRTSMTLSLTPSSTTMTIEDSVVIDSDKETLSPTLDGFNQEAKQEVDHLLECHTESHNSDEKKPAAPKKKPQTPLRRLGSSDALMHGSLTLPPQTLPYSTLMEDSVSDSQVMDALAGAAVNDADDLVLSLPEAYEMSQSQPTDGYGDYGGTMGLADPEEVCSSMDTVPAGDVVKF